MEEVENSKLSFFLEKNNQVSSPKDRRYHREEAFQVLAS